MSLSKQLEELHAEVVKAVTARVACVDAHGDPLLDDEGNPIQASNDDLRVALALLKQNQITANLGEDTEKELRSRMAGKLDFSALKGKVLPLDDRFTA